MSQLSYEVAMSAAAFERFAVNDTRIYVSICRNCLQFIAAAPDPMRLALAEVLHDCSRACKKPPTSVLPQIRQMRSHRL